MRGFAPFFAIFAAASASTSRPRRVLREADLHYGLGTFNERFATRANAVFNANQDHFHPVSYTHLTLPTKA